MTHTPHALNVRLAEDGAVLVQVGDGAARRHETEEAVAAALAAGEIPAGEAAAVAAAGAMALAMRRHYSTQATDLIHARLLTARPDDLVMWRALARMREVLDMTPPGDRAARARVEATAIAQDAAAARQALARALQRVMMAGEGVGPTVWIDPALLDPGLETPTVVEAALIAMVAKGRTPGAILPATAEAARKRLLAAGVRVVTGDTTKGPSAFAPLGDTASTLVLLACRTATAAGDLIAGAAALSLATAAAPLGVPVWAVLTAGQVDWEGATDRQGSDGREGCLLLDAPLLTGHVTERGPVRVTEGGLVGLFPDHARVDETSHGMIANDY